MERSLRQAELRFGVELEACTRASGAPFFEVANGQSTTSSSSSCTRKVQGGCYTRSEWRFPEKSDTPPKRTPPFLQVNHMQLQSLANRATPERQTPDTPLSNAWNLKLHNGPNMTRPACRPVPAVDILRLRRCGDRICSKKSLDL